MKSILQAYIYIETQMCIYVPWTTNSRDHYQYWFVISFSNG